METTCNDTMCCQFLVWLLFFMCVSPQPLKWISVSVLESWRVSGCTSRPDVAHQREPLTHIHTRTHNNKHFDNFSNKSQSKCLHSPLARVVCRIHLRKWTMNAYLPKLHGAIDGERVASCLRSKYVHVSMCATITVVTQVYELWPGEHRLQLWISCSVCHE